MHQLSKKCLCARERSQIPRSCPSAYGFAPPFQAKKQCRRAADADKGKVFEMAKAGLVFSVFTVIGWSRKICDSERSPLPGLL